MPRKKTQIDPPKTDETVPEATQPVEPDISAQVDALDFLDEGMEDEENEETSAAGGDSRTPEEIGRANQAAAMEAIKRMEGDPRAAQTRPLPESMTKPTPISDEDAAKLREKRKVYRVVTGGTIAAGASRFTMNPGKIVTNNEYDIEGLKTQGIVFEEIKP